MVASIFLISNKNKKYVSNILLALFLLFYAQDSSGLISYYLLYPKFPALGLLLNSTVFLVYPLFFLYVLSVIDENFKLKKIHLIHIVFFVINFLVFVPSVYAADFQSQVDFLDYDTSQVPPEIKISYFLIHIQIPIYLLLSYFEIRKYKTLLFENYSNVNSNYFKWLIQLILLFSIQFLVGTLKNVFRFKGDADVYVYFSFL